MSITAADVKKLRDLTGAGMMDAKKALTETDGDFDKAIELLRVKGQAKAKSRGEEREATAGLVASAGGALVESGQLAHRVGLVTVDLAGDLRVVRHLTVGTGGLPGGLKLPF